MAKAQSTAPPDLSRYTAKRNFARTPEPAGGAASTGHRFVVQHHWARRDHFDFRLEMDGVLKSWAVTRGPSADPKDKRLAVRTEDHPVDYAGFEGTIPAGQYGGGTVILWDEGEWQSHDDNPSQALDKGLMKFALFGHRMQGLWTLVRMKPRDGEKAGRDNWLLIKERDEYVEAGASLVQRHTSSVRSGRSQEAIAANDPVPAASFPAFIAPCLCQPRDAPPEGPGWLHELKYDGYRLQISIGEGQVRLLTREGHDWTAKFPRIASDALRLGVHNTVIDGEAVVFDARGVSSFTALVAAIENRGKQIVYLAFDLLVVDGKDIRQQPLEQRKARLLATLHKTSLPAIRYAEHLEGDGAQMLAQALAGGAEGIVCKRAASVYGSGRTGAWIKVKGVGRDDFVIVGWLASQRGRVFSALLLAQAGIAGLTFAGRVGTGFSARKQAEILERLQPLAIDAAPPGLAGQRNIPEGAKWVKPVLSAQIAFAGWTAEKQLRHARFLELRSDVEPPKMVASRKTGLPPAPKNPKLCRLTHPDRVLFPDAGLTKAQLAQYYSAVAPKMLPHLLGRPVSFLRAPDGIDHEMFFQRHLLKGMDEGIEPVPAASHGKDYVSIAGVEGLLTAAQFSVVELHGWAATSPDLDHPDRIIFDLDPDETIGFPTVKTAAVEIRDVLLAAGLTSFPLLSGGKGIHVIAPLDRHNSWSEVEAFTRGLARKLAKLAPGRYVAVATRARRTGRIFIDYLRNKPTATAIVPYSTRARPGAPVAMPVDWTGLASVGAANDSHWAEALNPAAAAWEGYFELRQHIPAAAIKMMAD